MRDYIDNYLQLARLYDLLQATFTPKPYVDQDLMNKTRQLVHEHVDSADPYGPMKLYEIDGKTLSALKASQTPDSVKVINLAKSLAVKIAEEVNRPHLKSIGDMAVDVVTRYEERQTDTQTALNALEQLVGEYVEAKEQEAAKHFEGINTFSIYWQLRRLWCDDAQLAKTLDRIIDKYPHWQDNPEALRGLRLKLTVELMKRLDKDKVAQAIDDLLSLERQEA